MTRSSIYVWVTVLAVLTLAVGGCRRSKSDQPSPTSNGLSDGSSDGPAISAMDRLGWDQAILSGSALSAYSFAAYVDGARQPLADVRCDDGSEEVLCTARFPSLSVGSHTLEIVSILDGQESDRSDVLTVNRAAAASVGAVLSSNGQQRAAGDAISSDLASPTDLALSPDGRLIVTERDGRVLILDGRGSEHSALTLDDIDTRGGLGLFALALHPDFERNHYVYLAYTERLPRGGAAYRVVRTREVANTLGEVTTVLGSVPASDAGWMTIRFGPDRKLYAAIAALATSSRSSADAYNGTVLRLNDDGSTPADNPRSSPVFAEGVGVPSALAWTADAKLWLADSTDRGARLWRIGGEKYGLPGGVVPGGIAFQADGAGNTLLLARVDGGGISRFRMQLGSDAVHAATPLVGASFGRVRCVLPMGDSVYFCTDNAQDTGLADDRILRVPAS